MSDKLQRLELVWPGKNERVDVEPRILIEDAEKSYSADPKIQEKMNRQLFNRKLLQPLTICLSMVIIYWH